MKINAFENEKLAAFMSEKTDGSMRLHGHAEFDKPASERRAEYCRARGIDPERLIGAALVHGNASEVVSRPSNPKLVWHDFMLPKTDALITGDKGVFLSVTAADCSPVFLFDSSKEVIALVHSGWKGTLAAVVPHALDRMVAEFNCSPVDIQAYIGPGIQKCHFEVGADVAKQFPQQFVERRVKNAPIMPQPPNAADPHVDTWEKKDAWYVDLPAVIDWQLRARGVSKIACETMCTYCNKGIAELKQPPEKSEISYRWFSFRREKSDPLRTQMAVFGMK